MNNEKMRRFHYLSQKYDEYGKPLYLSYPVEDNWKKAEKENSVPVSFTRTENVDLYVHLPFCRKMCYFCCCDKITTQKDEVKEQYLDAVQSELELKFGKKVAGVYSSMHWGGGTPTYFSEKQIERLFFMVNEYFTPEKGSTSNIEAYPESNYVTKEKLQLIKQLGFESISLGIQDFDKRVQEAIHRESTVTETMNIVEQAKEVGLKVHVDLCYGLPFQGLNEFEKTLDCVKKIDPDQIVIYPYAHYPFLYPLQRKIPFYSIPNSFIKLLLMTQADEMLGERYTKYGIDTYIKKNSELEATWKSKNIVRNFMGTSIDTANSLIGIGASAVSRFREGYQKNSRTLQDYKNNLLEGKLPIERECIWSNDDRVRQLLIQEQILGKFHIDKKQIEELAGISFDKKFELQREKLLQFEKDGLLTDISGNVISLTEDGVYFARCIAHIFNEYYK